MKRSEKSLLSSLRNSQPTNSEEPLRNVKNSLGSLSKAVGNPLTKNELSINTDVFFYDVAAAIFLAPAAVPATHQLPLPVWYFGLTDVYSGYSKAQFIEPNNLQGNSWGLLFQGFWQYNIFAGLPGLMILLMQPGDYIMRYASNVPAGVLNPNIDAYVRIRCENIAYATLVHSLMSDIIFLNTIRFSVAMAAILQFARSIKIAHLSTFGKLNIDTIDPRLFILPTEPQQNIADLPVKIPIDKSIIITTQIDFVCQHFNFILFVEKIEVLTKRS
jgi:hypothetical protein